MLVFFLFFFSVLSVPPFILPLSLYLAKIILSRCVWIGAKAVASLLNTRISNYFLQCMCYLLNNKRQLNFEIGIPWSPGIYQMILSVLQLFAFMRFCLLRYHDNTILINIIRFLRFHLSSFDVLMLSCSLLSIHVGHVLSLDWLTTPTTANERRFSKYTQTQIIIACVFSTNRHEKRGSNTDQDIHCS